MFDTMLKRDLFAEFHSPSTPIGEITHKLFDKIAKRSKCFAMLYNVYRNCSFLYSVDGVATSTIKPNIIDQLRYIEFIDHSLPVLLGSSDEVAKARGSLETANNLLGDFRSYVCLFSDSMARPTMLSLLIELLSSEQVEPDLPLLIPFDFWVYDWGFYKSS
ncbi:hypothetical protein CQW23_08519 [Capsicum baccatum]|uniref:Uncharacterized protein n=1 Tax=Capsicum baccatum TaxID=33114 RepID=A0A2G2X9B4_CAPBA|nr:hypothetical protein CQW23_08519 [Capsicum baccatum]